MSELTFIVAGDPTKLNGSYIYDARMVEALRETGRQVTVIGLEGRFPEPDAQATRALDSALDKLPAGSHVVIDGLALGGLPEVIEAHRERLTLTALIHHPLADETGLGEPQRQRFMISETRALAAVKNVIATSVFTARRLADFAVPPERIQVIEPGVDSAPLAIGHGDPPRLLCVATLTPRKGHEVLIDALARLTDLPWQCDCIGGLDHDPSHARHVQTRIRQLGLDTRIHLLGSRPPEALSAAYQGADLFVLPSHYEGYGMVITEALAHGLPVVTTTGGALTYTLPDVAGLKVPPGDVTALVEALKQMLTDRDARARFAAGARQARDQLRDWQAAGEAFAKALQLP
ncbi:glycosyltransferase family 4 protein [Halomonas shantousis]